MPISFDIYSAFKDLFEWSKREENEKLAQRLRDSLISHFIETGSIGAHFYRRGRFWRPNEIWDCQKVFKSVLEIEDIDEATVHKWIELMMFYRVAKRGDNILYPCGELVDHCYLEKTVN